jgi:Phospholipase_D-nuclease N-terminal
MQYNLLGLVVLIADIWALINIFQSGADTERKILWTVLILLLPLVGFVAWYFAGPKTSRA